MFANKRVAVVMPAHNEALLIARAVTRVPDYVDILLVVDDASSDGTLDALSAVSRPGIQLLRHSTNRGVGGAIVSGYHKALQLSADVVAVMAGDAQMDPADLCALLTPVVRDETDYAKGDRLSWPGVSREMPFWRFVGNHVLSRLTRLSSGYRNVKDSQCGYTAISSAALRQLNLDDLYQRYGFPNDILARLHATEARVMDVPVRPLYGPERSEISVCTALFRVPLVLCRSFFLRLAAERPRRLPSALDPEKKLTADG